MLATLEASTAGPMVNLATRLLALTAVRPGIVQAARCSEIEGIDFDDPSAGASEALWRIAAVRMKLDLGAKNDDAFDHVVPLAPEAVAGVSAARRSRPSGADLTDVHCCA